MTTISSTTNYTKTDYSSSTGSTVPQALIDAIRHRDVETFRKLIKNEDMNRYVQTGPFSPKEAPLGSVLLAACIEAELENGEEFIHAILEKKPNLDLRPRYVDGTEGAFLSCYEGLILAQAKLRQEIERFHQRGQDASSKMDELARVELILSYYYQTTK